MIRHKTLDQLKKMRKSCLIIAKLHEEFGKIIEPGITTKKLDRIAEEFIRDHHAKPAFKGVKSAPDIPPFPGCICASVNEELVHGIPSNRELKEGDIVSIDGGCLLDGYYSDAARTFAVGEISEEAKRLNDTTRECLEAAIAVCKPGARLFDIGAAVEKVALPRKYSIVREYVGHGIGRELWEDPQVPNFVPRFPEFRNIQFRKGLVIAIEPMINVGTHLTTRKRGTWVVKTADGKLCSHWENTIAIVDGGHIVLTETTPCILDN